MNIVVQNPIFAGMGGLHGWIFEFVRRYRPGLYISDTRYFARLAHVLWTHRLNPFAFKLIWSEKELCSWADALVCFNGHPYRKESRPVRAFSGLKMYHLMDYTNFPTQSSRALVAGGVDFVFGYARHDLHCPFFQTAYSSYQGKVIPVPFGFAKRFQSKVPFAERTNKIIALGAVNSFDDPVHVGESFREVNEFFLNRGERFMHKFRRMLVEHESEYIDFMDSKLPHYPQVKDFGYDIVKVFNQYRMFVSCESLQYFPAAKTFEGSAAGAVMMCSTHPCFSDYGFEDGVNCIKHKEFDLHDFKEKVSYYMSHEDELSAIQKNAAVFVRETYNHRAVAQGVYQKILATYSGKEVS